MMHGYSERRMIPQNASNKNCDKTREIATFLFPWHQFLLLAVIRFAYSRDLCFQDITHNFMDGLITDIAVVLGAYPCMDLFITSKVSRNLQIIFQLVENLFRQRKW